MNLLLINESMPSVDDRHLGFASTVVDDCDPLGSLGDDVCELPLLPTVTLGVESDDLLFHADPLLNVKEQFLTYITIITYCLFENARNTPIYTGLQAIRMTDILRCMKNKLKKSLVEFPGFLRIRTI